MKRLAFLTTTAAAGLAAAAFFASPSSVQANPTVIDLGQPKEHVGESTEEKEKGNIIAVATAPGMEDFSTLVAAIKAADLVEALQGQGPYTVFAPTNEAFAKLPAGTVETLLKPENKEKLQQILLYHVVPAKVMAKDVKTMEVETLQGGDLDIEVTGSTVTVNDAIVIKTDVEASNGVIHAIDSVLLPKE